MGCYGSSYKHKCLKLFLLHYGTVIVHFRPTQGTPQVWTGGLETLEGVYCTSELLHHRHVYLETALLLLQVANALRILTAQEDGSQVGLQSLLVLAEGKEGITEAVVPLFGERHSMRVRGGGGHHRNSGNQRK